MAQAVSNSFKLKCFPLIGFDASFVSNTQRNTYCNLKTQLVKRLIEEKIPEMKHTKIAKNKEKLCKLGQKCLVVLQAPQPAPGFPGDPVTL